MKNLLLCKHNILTLCVLITVWTDAASGRGVINGTNQDAGSMRVEKIIHGMRSQTNSRIAPYMALIHIAQGKGNGKVARCAGVIIHKEWVLTAAHCVHGIHTYVHESQVRVFVGGLAQSGSPPGQFFKVKRVYGHDGYDHDVYNDHDIALLRLEGQIDTSNGNARVAEHLANGGETFEEGTECVIAGWGVTESGNGRNSEHLMELTIPRMISTQECVEMYATINEVPVEDLYMHYRKSWREHHICVFDFENPHKGTCNGDSGGPLICGRPGRDVLVGILERGHCDKSQGKKRYDVPDIYTRVDAHLTWIFEKWIDEINSNSDQQTEV